MMFGDHQPDEMAKVTVTAFIEEELKDDLKALADKERRSMSQMIAVIIEQAVDAAKAAGQIPLLNDNLIIGGAMPLDDEDSK